MSSIFTKILHKEIPAEVLWENENFFVIPDINPNNPGHILVIPKQELPYIFEIDEPLYAELWKTIKHLAGILKQVTQAKRVGLVIEGLGVEDHAHVHLIPINDFGDLDSTHKVQLSDEEKKILNEQLKTAFAA